MPYTQYAVDAGWGFLLAVSSWCWPWGEAQCTCGGAGRRPESKHLCRKQQWEAARDCGYAVRRRDSDTAASQSVLVA